MARPYGTQWCFVEDCTNDHYARGYCRNHYNWFKRKGVIPSSGEGYIDNKGYRRSASGRVEHVLVAEKALGRELPRGVVIHHINENKQDNTTPWNLVICPDELYHRLLHQRQKALSDCGNPNYRHCQICKKYDAPINMYCNNDTHVRYHQECMNLYRRNRYRG